MLNRARIRIFLQMLFEPIGAHCEYFQRLPDAVDLQNEMRGKEGSACPNVELNFRLAQLRYKQIQKTAGPSASPGEPRTRL